MEVNLIGGSAPNRYQAINSQRTINWCPILSGQQEQNKKQLSLIPTPGLTTYITLPGRYIRALFTAKTHSWTRCFAVVDNTLYEILNNSTYSTIGTLSNISLGSTRLFTECDLNDEVFFSAYDASYVYNMDTQALTQVTNQFFPNNVTGGTYLDQYTIVCANGAVFESLTTSMLNWSGTQTYSPAFKSAPVIAVGATKEQIFNFTTETIEVFINDGTSPYSRLPRTSLLIGIKAKDSLATWDNGFVFLGASRSGETCVYYYNGWNSPEAISTESITWRINQASTLDDVYGYIQLTKNGQNLYYLTIPALDTTFVYNFNSQEWFERRSINPSIDSDGTQKQSVFRGSFYTNFNGKNLFADKYSGKIFLEDYSNQTEDSNLIRRVRISQELSNEDKYISFDRMIIDCNTGQATTTNGAPILQISYSNDGGYTFSQSRNVSLGSQGNYAYRARLNKLGTARRRVYKFVLTDPVDLMIQSIYLNGSMDTN